MTGNIENLRKWFRDCPALARNNRFGVDFMSEDEEQYGLYSMPSNINYRDNVLGESVPADVQSVNFVFAARLPYGNDIEQNMINLGFHQDVTNWIIEQNAKQNFPTINEGRVTAISVTLTQYPATVGAQTAIYQIQIKLTYRR